jgi:hypothetical protein
MGGAAVVVAGVTECVALVLDVPLVLDESVVFEADEEGVCDDVVVLDPDTWTVDEGIETEVVSGIVAGVEVDVMVASVVSTAEDTAEDTADDTAEEDIEVMAVMAVEAADTEIKLPPLLNSVTVVGRPLTTTVETVTVLSGPVLLPIALLDPLAALLTLVPIVFVVCPNENEYVVIGSKEAGNVSNADESTESAFVVSGVAAPVTLVALEVETGKDVMVVYCVAAAVVWMGIITARVKDGGISTVAVGAS